MYKIDFEKPSKIYFVGIGGISMSGLAEILNNAGFTVAGSDRDESNVTRMLEAAGIKVFYGQKYENITKEYDCVIFTAAIHKDNPEYIATMELGIPYLSRAELLGQIMKNYECAVAVAGTHGKTTTTSMISEVLVGADMDPTVTVGGMLKSIGGNIRVGKSGYFVAEACEYTNSFLQFYPKVSVILNVEEDHMDFFKDLNDIRNSFSKFAALPEEDGYVVINGDIPDYREIVKDVRGKVITYSIDGTNTDGNPADYSASDINFNEYGCASFTLLYKKKEWGKVTLSVPGIHNVGNALAAAAVADIAGADRNVAAQALHGFKGTDRRFERKGEFGGVTVIDDYAHHPTEIAATLSAAAKYPHRKLWVVFQPHTYTRTKAFFNEFAEALSKADAVVFADIYSARETDTLGISSENLKDELIKRGNEAYYFGSFKEIEDFLRASCIKDDLLITMGAGDVYLIGEELLK
ncbi:MAG: UDP-N-acetylmuramate--L-alanine ligase [Lachnospiraceae bacterium]|nr:UDP-N-acetylmuramate--L-alanine ligase [Lachnospiraceae bacterium]